MHWNLPDLLFSPEWYFWATCQIVWLATAPFGAPVLTFDKSLSGENKRRDSAWLGKFGPLRSRIGKKRIFLSIWQRSYLCRVLWAEIRGLFEVKGTISPSSLAPIRPKWQDSRIIPVDMLNFSEWIFSFWDDSLACCGEKFNLLIHLFPSKWGFGDFLDVSEWGRWKQFLTGFGKIWTKDLRVLLA